MKMDNNKYNRDSIIERIRKGRPASHPLPEIPIFEIPGNEVANFVCHLKGFDGNYQMFSSKEDAISWLNDAIEKENKKIFSVVPEVKGNVELVDFKTPAEMHIIDTCVAEAIMGIGETGSLLVDNNSLGDPAAALFSTNLYLLIDRNKILKGLQDIYSAINLEDFQYSSFFTGPSATADIEAVHITGAQGFISLTAVVYNVTEEDKNRVVRVMTRLPNGTPLGQPDAKVAKLARYTDIEKGQDNV